MEHAVRDLLEEICRIIRAVDEEAHALDNDLESLAALLPSEVDQRKFLSLMSDSERRLLCMRLARHAATGVAFHILVLFDERKELGKTGAWPKLSLVVGDKQVTPPTYLHELLGEVMQDLGIDTDEWW